MYKSTGLEEGSRQGGLRGVRVETSPLVAAGVQCSSRTFLTSGITYEHEPERISGSGRGILPLQYSVFSYVQVRFQSRATMAHCDSLFAAE